MKHSIDNEYPGTPVKSTKPKIGLITPEKPRIGLFTPEKPVSFKSNENVNKNNTTCLKPLSSNPRGLNIPQEIKKLINSIHGFSVKQCPLVYGLVKLGEGSQGQVYTGYCDYDRVQHKVSVKLFPIYVKNETLQFKYLIKEATALRILSEGNECNNIINCIRDISLDVRNPNEWVVQVITDYIDGIEFGPSIWKQLRDNISNLDYSKYIKRTWIYLLKSLNFIHMRGVYHRDIKPENIMTNNKNGDLPVLIDFGLSCIDIDIENCTNLCGTPVYIDLPVLLVKTTNYYEPNELIASDMWSLAMVFYQMIHYIYYEYDLGSSSTYWDFTKRNYGIPKNENDFHESGMMLNYFKNYMKDHNSIEFFIDINKIQDVNVVKVCDQIKRILVVKLEDRPSASQLLREFGESETH